MGARKFTKQEQKDILFPLAKKLLQQHQKGKTTIVGLQGGQGTGKTTVVKLLEKLLKKKGYKVVRFSIDDFYKSYQERKRLQQKYPHNPFYQIYRGLPGTHRVIELKKTLQKIKNGKNFELPIFDKSLHNAWGDISKTVKVRGKQDFILFEGWCIGLPLVTLSKLTQICNHNKIKLPSSKHSKIVLSHIKAYQSLWKQLDFLVLFKPDSPNLHQKWRWQQERQLKRKTGKGMNQTEINRFVGLYLPFTYLCYDLLKPDVKVFIDKNHHFYRGF